MIVPKRDFVCKDSRLNRVVGVWIAQVDVHLIGGRGVYVSRWLTSLLLSSASVVGHCVGVCEGWITQLCWWDLCILYGGEWG